MTSIWVIYILNSELQIIGEKMLKTLKKILDSYNKLHDENVINEIPPPLHSDFF
jgi:hypothetical protein